MAYYPTNGGTSCIPDCLFRLFSFCRRLCTQILLRPLEEKQYIPESLNWQETALQVFVWSAVSLFIMMKFIVIFSCFALKSVVYWKNTLLTPRSNPQSKRFMILCFGDCSVPRLCGDNLPIFKSKRLHQIGVTPANAGKNCKTLCVSSIPFSRVTNILSNTQIGVY